ncbi:NAD(+) synthase [Hujiaoplasma nucleasis]|uniref:Glutamine-dependent NAD(+) synthetase n=1 Tax=Hujiaoplasma nucleasis TaxID=2725268 RepID=A0A7L6N5F6_9MOLU|nr:NAD(+) synthase [Hujiaoplasma nucleasis]QLY39724.1 NAD(+) synthase [Hujiaoplasma nucleasis]
MHKGFIKISLISPKLEVGNPKFNIDQMLKALENNPSSIAVFPELATTAYTCGDLFFQNSLFTDNDKAIQYFLSNNHFKGIVIMGMPLLLEEMVLNTAVVIQEDKILGIVPKFYLPNAKEYYEKRWFNSGFDVVDKIKNIKYLGKDIAFGNIIFTYKDIQFGVEICEDMWATITPGNLLSVNGANIIFNISASNETVGKEAVRRNAVLEHSRKNSGIYAYCSAGASESSSETVFSGHNIVANNARLIKEVNVFSLETSILYVDLDMERLAYERRSNSSFRDSILKYKFQYQKVNFHLEEKDDHEFSTDIDPLPFVPKKDLYENFKKIASIQEFGLSKRISHIGIKKIIVGISGGLDSSLALLVAANAFDYLGLDRSGIMAYTLPAMHTSERTNANAKKLMELLGVSMHEIDLKDHIQDHLKLLGHDGETEDITYENAQARARTMVLMNMANKEKGIVLGTGDLSEIALGWSTYNGDQMSMYNVNGGIPKTVVRFMIKAYADYVFNDDIKACLYDILDTPISPELSSNQKTENIIGKYEINDFILYRFLNCGDDKERIKFLLGHVFDIKEKEINDYVENFFKRFYSQQFKRTASPDTPKVFDYGLSPRSDYRIPSDVKRS